MLEVIMKGLIIREPWIDMILDGKKTWEIRGSNTKIRGKIYLIKSGTGMVFGTVDVVDCIPLCGGNDIDVILKNKDKHHVRLGSIPYKKPHAWVMDNPVRYEKPISYNHPQGAVIWVNIDEIYIPKPWIWGNEISDAVDNPYKCPTCPTCNEATYSMQNCPFCGQLLKDLED
jgi:hypothetical protein